VGHRIPVYYCRKCLTNDQRLTTNDQQGVIVSRIKPEKCPECGSSDIYQDEDVLDTWFSSWLWPFATFGWPTNDQRPTTNDLSYFYPTSVLVTAPEIIFFWVARMIMAGEEFMGDIPFRDVYIHGTVRDIEGKKMSKSLGNVIDPLEIINEYGADALRFSLISITAQGQDVYLSKERFEQGRNFANKIWNASRFILMNLDPGQAKVDLCEFFKKEDLTLSNRWILSRFYSLLKDVNKNLQGFKFNEAANALYGFFWHEFCDWYLELIKSDIKNKQNQVVMYKILEKFLRVSHPFMPFITEEIWQMVQGQSPAGTVPSVSSIMIQPWPHVQEQLIDKKTERNFELLFEVINALRNMRSELEIPLQNTIEVKISSTSKSSRQILEFMQPEIKRAAKIDPLKFEGSYTHQPGNYVAVIGDMHIAIPLAGVIDIDKYKQSLKQKLDKLTNDVGSKERLLANDSFIKKAPEEVVSVEKAKLKELNTTLEKVKGVLDGLK